MQKVDKVEWLSPGELIPYPQNAKQHPAEQIRRIANGIKAFGWTQPIVVDKDNVVVIGHGRLLASKELLLEKVPVVRRDDLTDEQIKALRLEDNKTNESTWDFDLLEKELAELAIEGIDMSLFGFDIPGDDFFPEKEVVEDSTPEAPAEHKAKRGDIFRLGGGIA